VVNCVLRNYLFQEGVESVPTKLAQTDVFKQSFGFQEQIVHSNGVPVREENGQFKRNKQVKLVLTINTAELTVMVECM
jgi:hypothetical protein